MRRIVQIFTLSLSLLCVSYIVASTAATRKYDICFAPSATCMQEIAKSIDKARISIYLQAYHLTSKPVLRALLSAKSRGVTVKAILDKSQWRKKTYSGSRILLNKNISVWIDYKTKQLKSNFLIIDKHIVITGALNFSDQHQHQHSAHILFLHNRALASEMLAYWQKRKLISKPVYLNFERFGPQSKRTADSQFQPLSIYKLYFQYRN